MGLDEHKLDGSWGQLWLNSPWSPTTCSPGSPCMSPCVVLFDPPIGIHGETDIRPAFVFRVGTIQQIHAKEVFYFMHHLATSTDRLSNHWIQYIQKLFSYQILLFSKHPASWSLCIRCKCITTCFILFQNNTIKSNHRYLPTKDLGLMISE